MLGSYRFDGGKAAKITAESAEARRYAYLLAGIAQKYTESLRVPVGGLLDPGYLGEGPQKLGKPDGNEKFHVEPHRAV